MTDNERCLLFVPNEGNYIEILGYKIDGYDSFEAFCEHLNKYAELEETVNRQKAEIERLRTETRLLLANSVTELYPHCSFVDNGVFVSKEPNGYEKWNAYVRNQAYKEFALELKRIPRIAVYKNEIDNLLREKVGDK